MSDSDPTPAPSSASAPGSSSFGPTSTACRSSKITKPWWVTAVRVTPVVVVVILLWAAAFMIPKNSDFLYGAAGGGTTVVLVLVALLVAKRFGYDTFFVRELERRDDERDKAASRRAWALTGVVGFFGNIAVAAVGAFGGPMMPALAVVSWLQLISLIGGNIYFNRTM